MDGRRVLFFFFLFVLDFPNVYENNSDSEAIGADSPLGGWYEQKPRCRSEIRRCVISTKGGGLRGFYWQKTSKKKSFRDLRRFQSVGGGEITMVVYGGG